MEPGLTSFSGEGATSLLADARGAADTELSADTVLGILKQHKT